MDICVKYADRSCRVTIFCDKHHGATSLLSVVPSCEPTKMQRSSTKRYNYHYI